MSDWNKKEALEFIDSQHEFIFYLLEEHRKLLLKFILLKHGTYSEKEFFILHDEFYQGEKP